MHQFMKIALWPLGVLLLGQMLVGCGSSSTESVDSSESTETPTSGGSAEQIVLAIGGESEESWIRSRRNRVSRNTEPML